MVIVIRISEQPKMAWPDGQTTFMGGGLPTHQTYERLLDKEFNVFKNPIAFDYTLSGILQPGRQRICLSEISAHSFKVWDKASCMTNGNYFSDDNY